MCVFERQRGKTVGNEAEEAGGASLGMNQQSGKVTRITAALLDASLHGTDLKGADLGSCTLLYERNCCCRHFYLATSIMIYLYVCK